nr:LOW QUALITY PROTEIN: adenylate kinase-like [Nerophis lumbriciformis]
MRIILLGAPGSGKGTQATLVVRKYQVPHISTGELLRAEVAAETELGNKAKANMEAGDLVSDEIVLGMIEERLHQDDVGNGFLLDGFPRTLAQSEGLDKLLSKIGQPLDLAIFLDVDYGEIMQRLLARKRVDDTEETIRNRLEVYEARTAPLIDYYKAKGNLRNVQGVGGG